MADLVDKARIEIKLGGYGTAAATALDDPTLLPRTQDYRRTLAGRMTPLDREEIHKRVPPAEFHVSRKVDGEFTVLVFRNGEIATLNPGGTVRIGMPWQAEAARLLSASGVSQALVAGELYVDCSRQGRRPRVHDVTSVVRQPESDEDLGRIRLAVFDLLEINGEPTGDGFRPTWDRIEEIFGNGELIHPVEAVVVTDADGIARLFDRWVEQEGAEGIVARSDAAGWFKIKPRHTLDAAVIGFTESLDERQGMLHDLLLSIMRPDGTLQVLSRVGGGFSDDQRREMLSDLKDMVVESEYVEVNSDHVAYQLVRPEWVVEISCLDLISQTTRGGPVNRMVLQWHEQNGSSRYEVVRRLPLAAVISPQFIRRRDDKQVAVDDIRIAQITDVVEVPLADRNVHQMTLPTSELLRREVYTKLAKGQTMVRKLLVWKTNKDTETDEFPAYVLAFTDFSPNRKDPLSRELRVSSSATQIMTLADEMIASNIKAGWQLASVAPQQVKTKQAGSEPTMKQAVKTKQAESAKAAGTRRKKKSS